MESSTPTQFVEPVIFHKLSQLYLAAHARVAKFPKPSRYSLGVRTEQTVLEIMELCYRAQFERSTRLSSLQNADIKVKMLHAHLRLAYKIKCLGDAGFAELSESTIEIGKMLGGWIKETKNPA